MQSTANCAPFHTVHSMQKRLDLAYPCKCAVFHSVSASAAYSCLYPPIPSQSNGTRTTLEFFDTDIGASYLLPNWKCDSSYGRASGVSIVVQDRHITINPSSLQSSHVLILPSQNFKAPSWGHCVVLFQDAVVLYALRFSTFFPIYRTSNLVYCILALVDYILKILPSSRKISRAVLSFYLATVVSSPDSRRSSREDAKSSPWKAR